ncbi:ECF transporter S component [Mycoplasmopsis gallinarum]
MKNWPKFSLLPKLNTRKIAFIAILIAISVAFFIIIVNLVPIASIPTFKISFIGLPIKISGFIFGPIIGGLVGCLSDLISFLFVPNVFNPYYILAAVVNGVVSGIIGWLFLNVIKNYFGGKRKDLVLSLQIFKLKNKLEKLKGKLVSHKAKKIRKLENNIIYLNEKRKKNNLLGTQSELKNFNGVIATLILVTLILLIIWIIGFKVPQSAINNGVIKNRLILILLMISGFAVMIIFIWIARFKMKDKNYFVIVPIIIFSALIEFINVPILSLADSQALSSSDGLFIYIFQHTLFSPVKIWFNMFIIFFTFNVINGLINKNSNISY